MQNSVSQITTSISQSRRLLEAGIDPQTADMMWTIQPLALAGFEDVPAWSLSALISLLPEHAFYRIARARGKDIEGIFEDCVTYLCLKSDYEKDNVQ